MKFQGNICNFRAFAYVSNYILSEVLTPDYNFNDLITGFSSTFVEKAANIMIHIDKRVLNRSGFCTNFALKQIIFSINLAPQLAFQPSTREAYE